MKTKTQLEEEGIEFPACSDLEGFIGGLPFSLTGAQKKVLSEIEEDMGKAKQMNRLVQEMWVQVKPSSLLPPSLGLLGVAIRLP